MSRSETESRLFCSFTDDGIFAVSLAVSQSRANNTDQPRCQLEEDNREANKANEKEQEQAPIASVRERDGGR